MKKPGIVSALDGLGWVMIFTGIIGIVAGFAEQSWTIGGIGVGVICSSIFAFGFAAAIQKLYQIEFHSRPKEEQDFAKRTGIYNA